MDVFEMTVQLAFSENISYSQVPGAIRSFILSAGETGEIIPGNYIFDYPYPREEYRTCLTGKIYSLHIRSVSEELVCFLSQKLSYHSTEMIQGLSTELEVVPRRQILRLFSVTPVVFATKKGYWRNRDNGTDLKALLTDDMIGKYNFTHPHKLKDHVPLFQSIRLENRKPIPVRCGSRILLGDRLDLIVEKDDVAQEVIYTALGMGIGDYTTFGCGFAGYRIFREWG